MWFMDSLKKFWEKTKETFNNATDYIWEKIWENALAKSKSEIDDIIEKSKTTEFFKQETWETKFYKHKTILIVVDEKSEAFKDLSILYPVFKTKTFSQNMNILMSNFQIEDLNLQEKYELSELPAMIVFQDKEIYKTIFWKENIEKIWKTVRMNIEQTIDEF